MKVPKMPCLNAFLVFFLFFFLIPVASAETEIGGGRISLILGKVLIQTEDGDEWTEASVNFPIMEGDRILTEQDGRAELQFRNGTYVRIGEKSQVDVIALHFDQGKSMIRLYPLEGKIYVNHRKSLRGDTTIHIDLPYGVLTAYGPSRFRIDHLPSEVKISVFEGSVEVDQDGRPVSLAQGRVLILTQWGYTEVAQFYGQDEWDLWNEARDSELDRRQYARSDLPSELETWEYEMERNGRWVYTPEYQYVWIPRVVVGWAPFRYGYWTWRRGIYCWVPSEPWGWVPFHYGRWVHIHVHGWVWVPPLSHAVHWHPGAVGWYVGPRYISWVPLAPGEIYYGHRYHGPHSVNISREHVPIQKNAFINARVRDGVVTVHKDSFFKRNPVNVTKVENPFLRPIPVSGPPTEKPLIRERVIKPSRPIKELSNKNQPERKFQPRGSTGISPAVGNPPRVFERRHFNDPSEQRVGADPVRNRDQRTEQPRREPDSLRVTGERGNSDPIQGKSKNKDKDNVRKPPMVERLPINKETRNFSERPQSKSLGDHIRHRGEGAGAGSFQGSREKGHSDPVPKREGMRIESPGPVRKGPERIGSKDAMQNRVEREERPRSFRENTEKRSSNPVSIPIPKQGRGGSLIPLRKERNSEEMHSGEKKRSFPPADARGQTINQPPRTRGRTFEGFPGRRFR